MLLLQALMSNPITDLLLGSEPIFLFTAIVTCRAASRGDLGSDQHLQTRVHILFSISLQTFGVILYIS